MTDRYAVIGNPISHSKSPEIHRCFAALTEQNMRYDALLAPLDGFSQTVKEFQKEGGLGMNVTLPFKQEAFELVKSEGTLTERAQRAGAVNTLIFHPDGDIEGDNTDGIGLIRDLQRQGNIFIVGNILILGAGGAVRGVLKPLLELKGMNLVIANRTPDKAIQLAHDFADLCDSNTHLSGCGYEELKGQQFNLIINGTSASLSGELPPLPDDLLEPGGVAYDMAYSNEPTTFQRWAEAHGAAKALDGFGMLLEQAAESFYLWRGISRHRVSPCVNDLSGMRPSAPAAPA